MRLLLVSRRGVYHDMKSTVTSDCSSHASLDLQSLVWMCLFTPNSIGLHVLPSAYIVMLSHFVCQSPCLWIPVFVVYVCGGRLILTSSYLISWMGSTNWLLPASFHYRGCGSFHRCAVRQFQRNRSHTLLSCSVHLWVTCSWTVSREHRPICRGSWHHDDGALQILLKSPLTCRVHVLVVSGLALTLTLFPK